MANQTARMLTLQTTESNISINMVRHASRVLLTLKIYGELTHDDYIEFTEQLEVSLSDIEELKVNALVDITELESWTLHGSWDDLQLGLSRHDNFKKIAIIGNQSWQQLLGKVADWFVTADVHYFEDKASAIQWLTKF